MYYKQDFYCTMANVADLNMYWTKKVKDHDLQII